MYEISDEAREYLENGFPEERLVRELSSGPKSIAELSKHTWFSIGLSWAKKRGWVAVENGMVRLLVDPAGAVSPEREMLERVERGIATGEEEGHLLSRKLIRKARKEVVVGDEIGQLTHEIIISGKWKGRKFRRYDVEKHGKMAIPGKRQAYRAFLDKVRRKLTLLGFREMAGPLVETEFWNFDALFQPQNHPAREWTDTYQLKNPEKGKLPAVWKSVKEQHEKSWGYEWKEEKAMQLMPRAHGTAISARVLASNPEIPSKYYAIARVFRPDVLDATHLIEFNQVEGIVLDKSLKFRHLLGILESFAREIAGAENVKFLPDYYPFTEPSVQMSAYHPDLGWVEFGGAGIFREELTGPLGIDVPVIAWGIGIDRLAMFKLGIDDIRYLFSYDLDWLRNARVI